MVIELVKDKLLGEILIPGVFAWDRCNNEEIIGRADVLRINFVSLVTCVGV